MSKGTTTHAVRIPTALWNELKNAAAQAGVSVSEIIRRRCTPNWETPSHTEVDLSEVNPEDLGLDPFAEDPLVKAILAGTSGSELQKQFKELQQQEADIAEARKTVGRI